jgi:hypothetical protein
MLQQSSTFLIPNFLKNGVNEEEVKRSQRWLRPSQPWMESKTQKNHHHLLKPSFTTHTYKKKNQKKGRR